MGHTYSCCCEGKARGTVGHSAMFFLERALGQCNCVIHFKEAPPGRIMGAKQENTK